MTELVLLGVSYLPLLIAGLITFFKPLQLKSFQVVYLILGGLWIAFNLFYVPSVNILLPISVLIAGVIAHILLIGFYGNHISSSNHASIQLAIGLFPWYIGVINSLVYVLLFLVFAMIISTFNFKQANRAFGIKVSKADRAEKLLSKEDYEKFRMKASVILSLPAMLAAYGTFMLYIVGI